MNWFVSLYNFHKMEERLLSVMIILCEICFMDCTAFSRDTRSECCCSVYNCSADNKGSRSSLNIARDLQKSFLTFYFTTLFY
jgi:hypothetical protein